MTAAFEVRSTPTFRDLQGRFAKANTQLLEDRRDMMRALGDRFVEYASAEAPGGPGHAVANELGYRTFNEGDALGFQLTTGPIAKYHVFGTGIYGPRGRLIRPVSARALHFFVGGNEVFARAVRGVKPNKFIGRAYRRWLPGARSELVRISAHYTRTIAGSGA